jgi:hypothetical protein
MSEFKTQYDNPLQSTGLKIIEPTPADDRLIIASEDLLQQLFVVPLAIDALMYIDTLYDGLVLLTGDSKKEYVWCESDKGLLDTGYTYPAYSTDVAGQDYGGKTYNFVLFDKVAKMTIIYDTPTDTGLFIDASLLPYKILKEMSTAMVIMKSAASGFQELEHPDHIVFDSSGITIILDPKPYVGEQFRITIY